MPIRIPILIPVTPTRPDLLRSIDVARTMRSGALWAVDLAVRRGLHAPLEELRFWNERLARLLEALERQPPPPRQH